MDDETSIQLRGAYCVVRMINNSLPADSPMSVRRNLGGVWYLRVSDQGRCLPIDMAYLVRASEPALSYFVRLLLTIAEIQFERFP